MTPSGVASLTIDLGPLRLGNPVLAASGTFGYASELQELVDLRRLGGIVTKTVTVKPRPGNPPPRIVETPAGMLNAIGLQNVGIDRFVAEKLPFLAGLEPVVLVSIMGYTTGEFVTLAERLDGQPGVDGLELNLSCPNVAYGAGAGAKMFAHDAGLTAEAVGAVRAATSLPVVAKLGPDVADIAAIGRAAAEAGADALAVMNTIPGMVIDIERRRPVLANVNRRVVRAGDSPARRAPYLPVGACGGASRWWASAASWITVTRCSSCWPGRARCRSARPPLPIRAPRWRCWMAWKRYRQRIRLGAASPN